MTPLQPSSKSHLQVKLLYMRQTVDNLVINAINFSQEGVIRISVLRKGSGVEFVISDNGIGIPKESQSFFLCKF